MTVAFLEQNFSTPVENLACDEALLDERVARGAAPGVLRFWESPEYFVVLGFANQAAEEVQLEACRADRVPVLRRCSGGGTVLQGPGCLNYSLVLPATDEGALGSITGANQHIMSRHRHALAALLNQPVSVEGHTDLVVGGRKFSGNAQRRKRHWLLFHGTFLLGFDLARIRRWLRLPPRQPAYRQGRAHEDFVVNLPVSRERCEAALRTAWDATGLEPGLPREGIARLVAEKYGKEEWNLSR